MSASLVAFMLFLVQHFPPPPPPLQVFDLESAVVDIDQSGGLVTPGVVISNRDFRRAVRSNICFNGYCNFFDIWSAVQSGAINTLTRNNWNELIRYTRINNLDSTRTDVCEAAKADNQIFNGRNKCRNFYLPIPKSLSYILVLSFLILLFSKSMFQKFKGYKYFMRRYFILHSPRF
jgi:hypothetical protein